MATKRTVDVEEETSGSGSGRPVKKQRPIVGPGCPGLEEMPKLQCMDSIPRIIEPFLRKIVREEVDRILWNFVPRTSSVRQIADTRPTRRWQLRFRKKLPATVFAGTKLEADDNSVMEVSMIDTFSNAIVTTGDFSAIRTEILVLDGGFGQEDWTPEEFNGSLVHERDGKRPLLAGDLSVLLYEGSGVFGDVNFTDNSSWTRSRKFRLGLRAVESSADVKEAVSGAFMVKDHRGELYKKHHPPALSDDVWRLEKIGKDGVFHRKLAENGISTVQDLLRFLVVSEDKVRSMLGNGMSNRTWETIIQHAWECWIENVPCCYYNLSQLQLYFNSILQPVGVKFHGSYYQSLSDLNLQDQALVNKLKQFAYINQKDIVPIDLLDFPGHRKQIKQEAIPCMIHAHTLTSGAIHLLRTPSLSYISTSPTLDSDADRKKPVHVVSPKMKDPLITSRRGLFLMVICVLCGFVGFLLSLAAEATRSEVTWLMVTGGSGNGTHQCFYTRSGKTAFTYAIAAFFMLAIAMLAEHAFILRSLSSDRPPALSSWTMVDVSRSPVISTLTWKACTLFVTTWIAFAIAEVLLVIGIGIESRDLSGWKALRYNCVAVKEGLFVAAGIFGLVTVFLAAGLYMTALRAQRFHQSEQQNSHSHQRTRGGGGGGGGGGSSSYNDQSHQEETSTASV